MDELIKRLQARDCNFTLVWQRSAKLWYVRIPWYDISSHSKDLEEAMRIALQMIEDNPPMGGMSNESANTNQ